MNRIRRVLRIAQLTRGLGVDYDCTIVGVAGEVIAEERLGMKKADRQAKGIDGHIEVFGVNKSVQVKSLSSGRLRKSREQVTFKVTQNPEPELLVVVVILDRIGDFRIVYTGPTALVGKPTKHAGAQRRPITFRDLFQGRQQELKDVLDLCQRDA